MRLDALENLIHSSDFSSFRELCLRYLKLSGYQEPVLTDGSGDLGRDISLWQLGVEEPIAIQASVQKNRWKQKVISDATQVKDKLGITNFTYMTTLQISGHDEQTLANELWANHHITARFIDRRGLASFFHAERRSQDALEALGITEQESAYGTNVERPSLREDLAYAYAFFGTDVDTFRKDVIERSIIAFVTSQSVSHKREEVEDTIRATLGLSEARSGLVSSRLDHMLQRGIIRSEDGRIVTAPGIAEEARAVRTLRSKQWRELQDEISTQLGNVGLRGSKLEKLTLDVSETAGALIMSSADTAKESLTPGSDVTPIRRQIEVKLRQLQHRITAAGIPIEDATSLMKELTTIISDSDIGQTLLAGYLFTSLIDLSEANLLRALGGNGRLDVYLDASVAIPILASLLYEAHDNTFFRASLQAYEQAAEYDLALKLPYDYLEEAASHLIDASQLYEPVREAGEDLRFSQNAFVAHFANLTTEQGFDKSFPQYAQSFGLTRAIVHRGEFRRERDRVMQSMQEMLSRYGIEVTKLGRPRDALMADTESEIAFTAKELGIERTRKLLEHDARTVAVLASRSAEGESLIFCTWDRLHLRLGVDNPQRSWEAMNPSMLSDLLALASPNPARTSSAAVEIAIDLSQAGERLGGEIWDELVRIEKTKLHDADLMAKAKAFKQEYVKKSLKEREGEPLAVAWTNWKAASSPPDGE